MLMVNDRGGGIVRHPGTPRTFIRAPGGFALRNPGFRPREPGVSPRTIVQRPYRPRRRVIIIG